MPRTIIVSNRLPTKVIRTEETLTFRSSEGGLATGLGSIYQQEGNVWVGWPGLFAHNEQEEEFITDELRPDSMAPVFLNQAEIAGFYAGFSNSTLWPTFHYFPQFATYDTDYWRAYVAVNEKYCRAVLALAGPDDTIWVHDYQLLLLPEMLRRARPQATIGFFLHIPFPSYELMRVLPWHEQLLSGMLGADLIGFHTFGYMRHFLSSVSHVLGLTALNGQLEVGERPVRVDAFPMGIDYERYAAAADSPVARQHADEYRQVLRDTRVILSIDRLDYTKGIAERLRAFELLLIRHPQWREQASLIMLVVPSRDLVPQYAALKEEIDELVGRINAAYRTIGWTPVHYYYRSLPLEELAGLYRIAEVALVTPMRDGVNLVAKEFVASKGEQRGVLILSERAGAARELSDALLINPTDLHRLADTLHEALTMPEAEQRRRLAAMQDIVRRYTVFSWTDLFLHQLMNTKQKQLDLTTRQLSPVPTAALLADYRQAAVRLLLLDYDGTLVDFHADPQRTEPDEDLRGLLRTLASAPGTHVVVISGRDRHTLQRWLGDLPIDFIAEHGVWLRKAGEDWRLFQPLRDDWKQELRPILELYVARTPGSFIEEKDFSLVWHYRRADAELGALRSRELLNHLAFMTANTDLHVMEGNKVLEIKNAGINKGTAAARWHSQYQADFILALGDDRTDEDTFRAMPALAYTVRVGTASNSVATYHVASPAEVRTLLAQLAEGEE